MEWRAICCMPHWVPLSEWLGISFERCLVSLNSWKYCSSPLEAFSGPVIFALVIFIYCRCTALEVDPWLL